MTSNEISQFTNSINDVNFSNVCSPITSLDEAWTYLENPPKWIDSIIELIPRSNTIIKNVDIDCHTENYKFKPISRMHNDSVPRTLVCHDMKGGYTEDRFIGPVYKGNGYTFYRWAQIDTFVYFSHHLITIPPLNWINVSHRNGVKILGTFITEWKAGELICDEILKSADITRKFANILADICVIFKLDGWLLNIENPVSQPVKLVEFVAYLTKLVHIRRPGSLVIWYDSVTKEGKLSWQNELNDFNRCYFDVCDGIFLNYTWKEGNLEKTVSAAKHRNLDVYVGVDVFGRNCYGGGHFNTYLAAEKIRQYDLSMAIFAQGWTHETLSEEPRETFMERFMNRDNAFWRSLWPYLYSHLPTLSFHTTFYCGSDTEFFKLNSQELQLTHFLHGTKVESEELTVPTLTDRCNCLQMHFDGKYSSCVITTAKLNSQQKYIHHLFSCDIQVDGDIIIYTYTKVFNDSNGDLSLYLLVQHASGSYRQIVCHSLAKRNLENSATLTELNVANDDTIVNKVASLFNYPTDWNLKCFAVYLYHCKILEIGAMVETGQTACLCGIGIMDALN